MAKESYYQGKIIKSIISEGGTALTGIFKTGEADIQASYPMIAEGDIRLFHLVIEVKTPEAYTKLMSGLTEEFGLYKITDDKKLKQHEFLQIHKLNEVRKRRGLALIAHSYEQVVDYVNKEFDVK